MTSRLHDIPAPPDRRTRCARTAVGVAIAAFLTCDGAAWAQAAAQQAAQNAAGLAAVPAAAQAAASAARLPTFAELEAAGATIGQIRVSAREIFDTSDPEEDYRLFRWANALHIQTRPHVIERALLFKSGERVSARLIEETERLLRASNYLYDVELRPTAYRDGVVDIEVVTRDTWSLDLGINVSRQGGENSSGIRLKEANLLGTGTSLSIAQFKDVDRTTSEFQFANNRAFGTWTAVGYSRASNSDGSSEAIAVVRPFYELDARWAAGVTASRYDRIDAVYNAGDVVSQYRHQRSGAEVFGGRSRGLIDGWVQRYSLGLSAEDNAYATEPGLTAPAQLPTDQKLVGPFVRWQVIEERFDRQENRNLMGRPEFFELGLDATLQLGLAATALGSSENALLYSGMISRGFKPVDDQTVIGSAAITGQLAGGQVQRQQLGGRVEYYRPQSPRWLFYGFASADILTNPDANQTLMLGGDNGLRGYPLRYQNGTRRMLFTAEERYYTDLYLWRLFRIGAAAFADVGRAWGGDNTNTGNPGWLADLGFGLRIVSVRSSFGNVLHLDIAMPMNTTPEIQRVQFLVTTKTSF